jgi:hypothetical protein
MVSLAVAAEDSPFEVGRISLRDSAFWYPEIPPENLHLNDDSFTARNSCTRRFEPLCWSLFGGVGDRRPRSLTGVSFVSLVGSLRKLQFRYDTEDVLLECVKVGRHESHGSDQIEHFSIDGPPVVSRYLRKLVNHKLPPKATVTQIEYVRNLRNLP